MSNRRMLSEKKTVRLMVDMYCFHHHSFNTLCDSCMDLLVYVNKRIESCMFGSSKPVCSDCSVHCFKPIYREQIRQVMRFSGPKMIYKNPLLVIIYLVHKNTKVTKSRTYDS